MPKSRFYPLLNEAAADGTASGGASVSPSNTAPEVFSKEYVRELREENKNYRLKAAEMERKAQEAEEQSKKAAEEAEGKVKEAHTAAEQRIIRAELKAAATKAGMIDLDGLKLADLSSVKLNESGELEGADALMEKLKADKPYLFAEKKTTSSTEPPPKQSESKPKSASEMTPVEWAAEKKRLGI